MAAPIYCDSCSEVLGVLIITNIENGETFAVCGGCLPAWCVAMLQELAPGELQGPATQATDGALTVQEGEAAPNPPRPKRRRSGRQAGPEALTSPESPFQEITPDSG